MPYERKTHDIIISDDLKIILQEIESDSIVAQLLLKKRIDKDLLIENPVNYISIAHDKSKISYITTDRISTIDPSKYWTTSKRFAAKPGAFVGKIFKDISSKDVEKFSNLYKSCTNKVNFTFKIVEGKDILKYYHLSSYANQNGTLGASCMKHDNCQNYFNIYAENPNIIKMLIMLDSDGHHIIGRSLLWNFEGNKLMDRIYTTSDSEYLFHFKKWATKNEYLYKSEQNWYDTLNFENLLIEKKEIEFNVKLDKFEFRKYPYLDTFKFINVSDGILTNYIPKFNFRTLCGPDGSTYNEDFLVFDSINRVIRHRGDSIYLEYLSIYTHINNAKYSDINNQYILCDDAIFDREIEDYIFNEKYNNRNNIIAIEERKSYIRRRREERNKIMAAKKTEEEARLRRTTYVEHPLWNADTDIGFDGRYFTNVPDRWLDHIILHDAIPTLDTFIPDTSDTTSDISTDNDA